MEEKENIKIEPYKHHCSKCIFVGRYWHPGNTGEMANIYFHPKPEDKRLHGLFIARYSDEPSDYVCKEIPRNNPGPSPISTETGDQEPYEHDCLGCVWVGWFTQKPIMGNVWFCPPSEHFYEGGGRGTVIIRRSSVGHHYWSMDAWINGHKPEAVHMDRKEANAKAWLADQEARRKHYAKS